jgi:hypothetical protein
MAVSLADSVGSTARRRSPSSRRNGRRRGNSGSAHLAEICARIDGVKCHGPTRVVDPHGGGSEIGRTQATSASGDIVPADGRIVTSATLELQEAALTGESAPVAKHGATVLHADTVLGDRTNLVFQNTQVTRGTAAAVVTATGESTQMGRIADMVTSTKRSRSPLQRELDGRRRSSDLCLARGRGDRDLRHRPRSGARVARASPHSSCSTWVPTSQAPRTPRSR